MKKEMIKAIRLVNGFTPDLRVKINCNKNCLFYWIEANRIDVLGMDMATIPEVTSPEWDAYERRIWKAVREVMSGQEEWS